MRRSCECPHGVENPNTNIQTKPTTSRKNEQKEKTKTWLQSESRLPLKEVHNRPLRKPSVSVSTIKSEVKKPTRSVSFATFKSEVKKPTRSVSVSSSFVIPLKPKKVTFKIDTPSTASANAETQTSFTSVGNISTSKKAVKAEDSGIESNSKQYPSVQTIQLPDKKECEKVSLFATPACTEKELLKLQLENETSVSTNYSPVGDEYPRGKCFRWNFARKYATPSSAIPILSNNSGFMCAAEFFGRQEIQNHAISPIQPNVGVGENVLVSYIAEDKMPAQKKTLLLLRAKRARLERKNETSPFALDIYTSEYLPEIIHLLLQKEQLHLVKRNFMVANNNHLTEKDRMEILNWLLKIETEIHIDSMIYFMSVRLLDNILADIKIPRNMLQLVALVTSWMLQKNHGVTYTPDANKLLPLCGNVYTKKQILDMERKILYYTNFSLDVSNPCDFFQLYIKFLNIPQEHSFTHCIYYILELFSLDYRFSMFTSSEIASAATYLSMKYFEWDLSSRLKNCNIYHTYHRITDIVSLMDLQMKRIYKSPINEYELNIYKKYASSDHCEISVDLKNNVLLATI